MKIKRIVGFCISILIICLIVPGNNSVKSYFNEDATLLPSYKFNVGSKIVTITEHFEPKTGEFTIKTPIIKKEYNNNSDYFISLDEVRSIFELGGYDYPIVKDKEFETIWFAPNNKYIHFKWKKDVSGINNIYSDPYIIEEKAKWLHEPIEELLIENKKEVKKTLYHVQSLCSFMDYEFRVEDKGNKIIIKNNEGKTITISIDSKTVQYEQSPGPIEFIYYLHTPIKIAENRAMMDIQPLLINNRFGLIRGTIENYQVKPYNWEISYFFTDIRGKEGKFTQYRYSMPGQERIWIDDYILSDGKEIKWIVKPLIVGKYRIEHYQIEPNILAPIRTFFEMLGYSISWDQTNNEILIIP
jgi:hypothetical protein